MSLVADIREEIGDDLRAVATYHEDDSEVVYERSDVASKPRAIDRSHQELIMEGMGTTYLEDVFDVGKLNCTLHGSRRRCVFTPSAGACVASSSRPTPKRSSRSGGSSRSARTPR